MKVPNVKSSTVTPPDERGDIPDEDITTITPVIVKLVPPYDAIERPDTPVLSVSSSSVTIPKTDTSESSILMEEKSLSTTTPFFGGIKNLPPGYTKWRDPGTPASELSGSLMPMPVPPETDDNDNVLTSTPTKTTKTPDHHKMDESCLPSNHFTGPVYLPPKDSNSTVSATPTSSPTKPAMTRPASPESDDDNYDALPTPSSKSATDIPDHQEGSHPPTSFTGSEFSPPEATIMPAVETMYDFYEPA
ncbi:mucin-2-like [Cydia fagiglandana]|uniref:mucin-2-like n=1 Tax=Cydia fagiglandana TaxID=1458189 RepID=UPI002FEDEAE9